jgi:hypothetical protein
MKLPDTEIEGAMRVLEGTADAFVYDFPFNAVFRAMHPSNQLVFLDEPFTEEPIAWAIRKNDPDFNKGDAVLRRSRKGKKVRRSDRFLERTHGDVLPHAQTSTTFLTQSVG